MKTLTAVLITLVVVVLACPVAMAQYVYASPLLLNGADTSTDVRILNLSGTEATIQCALLDTDGNQTAWSEYILEPGKTANVTPLTIGPAPDGSVIVQSSVPIMPYVIVRQDGRVAAIVKLDLLGPAFLSQTRPCREER